MHCLLTVEQRTACTSHADRHHSTHTKTAKCSTLFVSSYITVVPPLRSISSVEISVAEIGGRCRFDRKGRSRRSRGGVASRRRRCRRTTPRTATSLKHMTCPLLSDFAFLFYSTTYTHMYMIYTCKWQPCPADKQATSIVLTIHR